MENSYDVIVIGAGIAGITAGIYLKRSSLKAVVLDKGAPGGKLNNIHRIDNYPGCNRIAGPELAMKLYSQAAELGVCFDYGSVISISKTDEGFLVETDAGNATCKAIIIATGVENKALGVPNEKEMLGRGVSYCATCDGNFFKGKDVAVIGNKDHAVEDVIYLAGLMNKVYFINPEPIESTDEHLRELGTFENVECLPMTSLLSIEADERVSGIIVKGASGEKKIPVSAVFPLFGEKSSTAFLSPLGVNSNKGFILADANMATNVPGVYACGDILDKKLRQLVNAAGEAAVAATSAIAYVHSLRK